MGIDPIKHSGAARMGTAGTLGRVTDTGGGELRSKYDPNFREKIRKLHFNINLDLM